MLENLGSSNPIWIQDFCPGSKKSFLNILDLVSGSKISALEPRFFSKSLDLGSGPKISAWILDSCALGPEVWQLFRLEIPSLTAVQTWNPKSEVPLVILNLMPFIEWKVICVCVSIKSLSGRSQGGPIYLNIYLYIYRYTDTSRFGYIVYIYNKYVYICVYTYIYVYIYICINVYIYVYVYIYIYIYIYVCIYI